MARCAGTQAASADDKARTELQKERLTRMFASLSATNEAIMRAKTRTEMFELVCEAAASGGAAFVTRPRSLVHVGSRSESARCGCGAAGLSIRTETSREL